MARSHSRKSHRKSRKGRKSQRGGSSCAAYPMNRDAFAQRGGMAPITAGDAYLLDAATRTQAGIGALDSHFAELPSVIPRHSGGSRKQHKSRKSRKQHKKSQKSRKQHKKSQKSRKSRKQRGGMAPFAASYEILSASTDRGVNPQFHTESQVNPLYSEFKGAQA